MATPRTTAAEALRDQLRDAGIKTHTDPAAAETNRPCVLIAPPVIDWTAGTLAGPAISWRLIALAAGSAGTFAAWQQIDTLVDQLEAAGLDVERAEPASYPLTPATGTVPAYVVTITTD